MRLVAGLDGESERVRTEIVDILVSWCSLVVHERGGIAPGTQTVEDLAVFLDLNLRWLARHDAAADFTAEVAELASAARRIANRVAEDAQWVSVSTRVRGRAGSRRRTRRRTRRPA